MCIIYILMYIFLKRVMGSDGCDGFMIILAGMEGMEGIVLKNLSKDCINHTSDF